MSTPPLTLRVLSFSTCHQPPLGVSSVSFPKYRMKFPVASFLAKLAATPTFWLLPFLSLNIQAKACWFLFAVHARQVPGHV